MAAYVVFCLTKVHDEERLAEYRRQAVPLLEATPGLKFFAGPAPIAIEGPPLAVAVVVELPDLDTAKRWYHSEEYQKVAAIRHEASTGFAFIVQSWGSPTT
ncbi:DUF1330 domain-containing protein [Rhizobium sp. NFR03]|uniref:DUF1330 domain-containing protein n=1 Tax=Rhizobium sp. NFR03 TaxID=1566263 RepID=UPI0008BF716F|nr:DUF1330 domain-containing protein [Rhizobium sp. NFR03]SES46748.1 Uncharacterized conserved protein, DUF1330 family [Rhizobium sp. NFR03]